MNDQSSDLVHFHLFFFFKLKCATFHMNFYLLPISNLSVMDMNVSFQIMFSEVPEQIILKGITGISNGSPESTHARKRVFQKRKNMAKRQPPWKQRRREFSQLFFSRIY